MGYNELMNNNDPNFMPLGSFLRKRRQEKGLSVRAAAEAIAAIGNGTDAERLSPAYISDIENSRREPSDSALRLLCAILDLSEEDLAPYDSRVPSQEMRDLALANKNYGVAFRSMVRAIHRQNLSPEDILSKFLSEQ